jgi:hypothetical protein
LKTRKVAEKGFLGGVLRDEPKEEAIGPRHDNSNGTRNVLATWPTNGR